MYDDRKLVTIRIVSDLIPIDGADFIELARIDGWQCIVKKSQFKVGDLAVYFECDSILPNVDEYDFLRKNCLVDKSWLNHPITGDKGLRIKTMKLRKNISQGLLIPVPEELIGKYSVDDDVTAQFNVIKWDPPVPAQLRGRVEGLFPIHLMPKTDEDRIQNCFYRLIRQHPANMQFEATVKLDGSSCTIASHNGILRVCSRNLELKIDDEQNATNSFCVIARDVRERILGLGRNLAFQGELMGPGIQGNREGLTETQWFVFRIWDIDEKRFLDQTERLNLTEHLGLRHCPVLGIVRPLQKTLDELLEISNDQKSLHNPVAEGIVYKSLDGSVSFKVISNKFLLRED